MSKKFSLSEGMLNQVSQNVKKANEIEAKNNFNVQYIDIKDIERKDKIPQEAKEAFPAVLIFVEKMFYNGL